MSIFSICIKQGYKNAGNYAYTFSKYIRDVNITAILNLSEIEV